VLVGGVIVEHDVDVKLGRDRCATKRRRHLPTVCAVTHSRAATALLLRPAAQPNTMRARDARACAVLRRCERQFDLSYRPTRSHLRPMHHPRQT
jgi:hypothetical protein